MDKLHGQNAAKKISTNAKTRGTILHSIIHDFWKNKQVDDNNQWWTQIKPFIKSIPPDQVKLFEKPLYFDGLQPYAGTPDLICNIDNALTVVDFKTSDRLKRRAWMESAFIQCAAYAQAYQAEVTQLAVICISPERCQCFYEDDVSKYIDIWNERLAEFYGIPVKSY